ncbi:hypothetical protein [Anaerotignum sp.]|uniref:hypothetical protein n=1 Tax=Anaerotignum sp. TaxID=2039241 RepID=UPI002A919CC1|nr:hypothetical protein [Anaerotignum sp.]MCI7658392.1 hypothetical protein [Clostridia bacterium]MDY5415665.1 hypothetical protein [Anaerotignum sp.]
MKFSSNYNLNLPDLDDKADIRKLNENFEKIDETMKSLEKDPELAANVVDIKNKIGEESDADTQPTLFGRLAQLKKVLLEKLAEVLTKITGIDGKIGTSVDTSGTLTLFGQVKSISEKMPTGSVKSIQRGTVSYSKEEDTKKISISRVNPEKCFVILNVTGDINSSHAGRFVTGSIVQSLTETELTIYTSGDNINNLSMTISWQVIECF